MNPNFSSAWWKAFLQDTGDLTKPMLFRNVITNDLQFLEAAVSKTIALIATDPPKQGLRVWIDGQQLPDGDITKNVVSPKPGESLSSWADQNYNSKQIGIILNGCQNHSEELKDYIADKILSLIGNHGLPIGGLEITLFLGNYDRTPLGFHIDPPGHKVIHFHMGPGRKEMYLMSPQKYEDDLKEITSGKAGFQEIEALKPHCDVYTIDSGDLWFMPHGYYHIGKSYGFSVGITLWHRDLNISELANRAMKLIVQKIYKDESNEIIQVDRTPSNDASHLFTHLGKILEDDPEIHATSIGSLLEASLKEYKLALYSNGFMDVESVHTRSDEPQFSRDDVIVGKRPYKVLYSIEPEKMVMFIQAKRLEFPLNSRFPEVIDKLNDFGEMSINDLFTILSDEWEEESCLYFVQVLYKHRAFDLVTNTVKTNEVFEKTVQG